MRRPTALLMSLLFIACADSTTAPLDLPDFLAKKGGSGKGGGSVYTVEVSPAEAQIAVGATAQLTATARDRRGRVIPDVPFIWSSSNPAVATVSANDGLVTGISLGGPVTVTAATGGKKPKSGTALVTVEAFYDEAQFLAASDAVLTVSYPNIKEGDEDPYIENGVSMESAGGWKNGVQPYTAILDGYEFGVSGAENIDITFDTPVSAFGLWMEDGYAGQGCPDLQDSQFTFTFKAGGAEIMTLTEDPPIGQAFFLGVILGQSADRLEIREVGSGLGLADAYCENDFFGKIYTK